MCEKKKIKKIVCKKKKERQKGKCVQVKKKQWEKKERKKVRKI